MKTFWKMCAIALPLVLMINLIVFFFAEETNVTGQFVGFRDIFKYMNTYQGFKYFKDSLSSISEHASSIDFSKDFWSALGDIFYIIGMALSLPIIIVIDIVRNVIWFLNLLFFGGNGFPSSDGTNNTSSANIFCPPYLLFMGV